MTWVITALCQDCLDISCVGVCPVNCIYRYTGTDPKYPNRLFIDPQECIDCGACEPECPWEAIFEDERVPDVFSADTALNALVKDTKEEFAVPETSEHPKPSPEQVKANKEKWGFSD